jgi:DNA polymerase-1
MNKTDHQAQPVRPGDHVFLIDGSGYIFRAYHALPPLTRPSDGLPVGAIHGFCQMLWKLLKDVTDDLEPTHLAVLFDTKTNYRTEIYPEYKAHRPPPPEDLIPQFSIIRDATRAFGVPSIEIEGYEADDLIATYTRQAVEAGGDVTIVSSDKDLMQLVRPGVMLYDGMKNRHIGEPEVLEKFGVGPAKVIDVQALAGDATDNVPGVPGIGVKTAAELINTYGDLDTLLARAGEIKQQKRREKLIEHAEMARISRELVKLKDDVPVMEPLADFALKDPDPQVLLKFLAQMEFTKLTARIAEGFKMKPPARQAPSPEAVAQPAADMQATPRALAAFRAQELRGLAVDRDRYETVTTLGQLQTWLDAARRQGFIAVDTETTSLDAMQAELVGVSLSTGLNAACYIPLGHKREGLGLDGDDIRQLPLRPALDLLQPMLEDPAVLKIGQNLKYDMLVLKQYGIDISPIDDTMLMSYVLDCGLGGHGMDHLASFHLGHACIAYKDVAGTGKSAVTFDYVPVDKATRYSAEDADITLRLWQLLKPRLPAEHLLTVYETLERPLVPVLVAMEHAGIKVDRNILSRLSHDFAQKAAGVEAEIRQIAGHHFNIASPKQLGDLLFGELGLPGAKKTKTGAWSTHAGILDDLAADETIPEAARRLVTLILDWRGLTKLKSTYTDALPGFINPRTHRIHTSYAMAATSTGRLASTDPNLQNIPVRTPEGRSIRTAFIAEPGMKLISADYSQVELRILAHIADIAALKDAFRNGLDIHAMTASEMFNVPLAEMTGEVRRRAKAINFGIIYGISAFGLANQLGISRQEAGDYIQAYFKKFPGIRAYMEATKEKARADGFVATLFGRRIHFPEIDSKQPARRAFMERASINAPIQGSAADIIRRAMIRMPAALRAAKLSGTMLLQVHDELIFEVPSGEVDATIPVVRQIMERACEPVLQLAVPLHVDAKAADNWDEAH